MALHTPAPWRTVEDAQGPCMVMHPTLNGVAIANLEACFVPANGYHDADVGERIANARLISAAPELLDALIEVTALLDLALGVRLLGIPANADGPAVKARAAIAKATGAQP